MCCPLCQNERITLFHEYERFTLELCERCDLIYQTRREDIDTAALIAEMYDAEWLRMRDEHAAATFVQHALFNVLLLEMWKPEKGHLLEVGPGTGEFLYTARSAGWTVAGLEPSALSCAYAKAKYGLELQHGAWPGQPDKQERYDAIACWHTLEHMPEPQAFLTDLAARLKPDGLLLLSVPNKNSFTNETYGFRSPLYVEPDHLFHYSRRSLKLLLGLSGFTPAALFSRQLPHDLETLVKAHPNYGQPPFEQTMALLARLQAQFRGHELVCVARRSEF